MNMLYDLFLTFCAASIFAAVYGAAWLVHKAAVRHTKGNPFKYPPLTPRQVSDLLK